MQNSTLQCVIIYCHCLKAADGINSPEKLFPWTTSRNHMTELRGRWREVRSVLVPWVKRSTLLTPDNSRVSTQGKVPNGSRFPRRNGSMLGGNPLWRRLLTNYLLRFWVGRTEWGPFCLSSSVEDWRNTLFEFGVDVGTVCAEEADESERSERGNDHNKNSHPELLEGVCLEVKFPSKVYWPWFCRC